MAKFAPHVGDPHGDPQTSPQHADPHGFLYGSLKERHYVHVDRRVVGWSAGRHVDHPCGGGAKFRHGLLEKSLKILEFPGEGAKICENLRFSAKICVLDSLCHLSSIPLSAN